MLGDDDLDVFFDTDDFAVTAVYTHGTDDPVNVNGIFTPAATDNMLQTVAIENLKPTFICATSDIPNIAHNDSFVIDGVTYYCASSNPDGTGVTTVNLSLDRVWTK